MFKKLFIKYYYSILKAVLKSGHNSEIKNILSKRNIFSTENDNLHAKPQQFFNSDLKI